MYFDQHIQSKDGFLNLDEAQTICINGLDQYAEPKPVARFEYARPNEEVKFKIV